jgi:pimeloyl-ACP methyl ester carboxylesterase
MAAMTLGAGPAVLVLPGLTADHTLPTGIDRTFELHTLRPLATRFTTHWVNRRPGLAPGTTIADMAADYAAAIETDIGEPVHLHGTSTGGAVAVQLAIDHPGLVDRLVLVATACRLSDQGREVQRSALEALRRGDRRALWRILTRASAASSAVGNLLGGLVWLFGPAMGPDDPGDMIVTLEAEDLFDAAADLGRIRAKTLIVAGGRDRFYGADEARETAAGIPDARLSLYPRKGHAGVAMHRGAVAEAREFLAG